MPATHLSRCKSSEDRPPMSHKNTTRPFVKIDTLEMRTWLAEVSAGELKTWFAYKLRANSNGEAWMTLATLAADTGLEPTTVSRHRNSLVRKRCLVPVSDGRRAKTGTFAPPRFRVEIPIQSGTEEQPHGKIAARHNSIQPHGKISQSRTAKLEYQEDSRNHPHQKVQRKKRSHLSAFRLPLRKKKNHVWLNNRKKQTKKNSGRFNTASAGAWFTRTSPQLR